MKHLLYIFLFGILSLQAQDQYNTKDGFIAEGYDVVSYFNNNAVEGDEKFTTSYDDVKFKFESQSHLETFKANPEKFIPEYGGYCAYAIADKAEKVSINPEAFEIRDGKLYLFYKNIFSNTLKKWQKNNNVKGLVNKADRHWEMINEGDNTMKKKN